MQVSIESGHGLERRMTVMLPVEEIDKEVDKRLKRIAREAKMHGFRPGKVPLSVIRQRYAVRVHQEVFGEMVQTSFVEAVNQEDLKPAGEPRIEQIEPGENNGFGYTAVFEVLPEFDLADFASVTVKRPLAEVSEDDVSALIEKLRKQRVTWHRVERPAAEGDQVTISYKGSLDGEPFDGGTADNVPLVLGSKSMVEDFEAGLEGASAGETRNLEVKFPDEYPVQHIAGRSVSFEIQISEVSEPVLPEVDDEFAKSFGVESGGVEHLRKDIQSNMERELEQRIRAKLKTQVMDSLVDKNKFDVPHVLIDKEIRRMQEDVKQKTAGGIQSGNMERPHEMFADQANRRVALGLIVSNIVSKNEIKVDKERVRQTVEGFAAEYQDPDQVIKWYYGNPSNLSTVEAVVLEDQVVDWVMGQVTVEEDRTTFRALVDGKDD